MLRQIDNVLKVVSPFHIKCLLKFILEQGVYLPYVEQTTTSEGGYVGQYRDSLRNTLDNLLYFLICTPIKESTKIDSQIIRRFEKTYGGSYSRLNGLWLKRVEQYLKDKTFLKR